MDNKINGRRLKTFFTYDVIKTIAVSLIVCVLLTLIFNALGKKATDGQSFKILVGDDIISGEDENKAYNTAISSGALGYGFSYEILTGGITNLSAKGNYGAAYMLNTFHEIGDDDVFIASETLAASYVKSGWAIKIKSLDGSYGEDTYVGLAYKYLKSNGFYEDETADYNDVNEQKVRENFIKTRGKDSRFNNAEKKESGVKKETERIKGLKKNIDAFKNLIETCPDLLASSEELTEYKVSEKVVFKGCYLMNLGALGDSFINAFKVAVKKTGEEGGTQSSGGSSKSGETEYTKDGIYLAIGNYAKKSGDLFFETAAYVLSLVKEFGTAEQKAAIGL